ncbi:MAG: iron chelate uptake ABC transporter family permease subunit [candidate division WS1 bacterium]|nr:iron chelate uptake ABC transporter family permease subunit [candidate division WS1 bacterium]
MVLLLVAAVAVFILSATQGTSAMTAKHALRVLWTWATGQQAADISVEDITIVRDIRLPRLILGMLVGACLAVAGAVMQAFFQNPMAAPSIIGVSAGGALGATAAIMFGFEFWLWRLSSVTVSAFAGALGVTAVVYLLSRRGGRTPVGVLLLTGIAVGSVVSAASSLILITRGQGQMDRVVYWMLGSLSGAEWAKVQMIWPFALLGFGVVYLYGRDLNVLLLGDEQAHYLGLNVEQVKLVLLVLSSMLAASAVAVSGVIGFVGLIIPHISRLIVGPDHRWLLPTAALSGAVLLALADLGARLGGEIPIGIITSMLGAPFFLYLLHRRREYDM